MSTGAGSGGGVNVENKNPFLILFINSIVILYGIFDF